MKLVYTHENRLFVGNAHNLLEQAGIPAIWKNEFTSSAIGEVAPISAWPELWVLEDADYERANKIISNAFASSNLPEWTCTQCKEINEPAFEHCWNCQQEKTGVCRMKFLLMSMVLICCTGFANAQTLDVMSYNIRCGSCEAIDNPNNWKKRKYLVAHLIKNHNPDIIGLQEAEINQVEDLAEMLDDYSWIGVGREDGKEKGETTAILFRHGRFTLQGQQTLWLSQTPQQVSRGWDAAFRRILSIAKLTDVVSKKTLFVFNTHFDNEGELARQESAKFLLAEIAKLDAQDNFVVTGDFNFKADSKGYEIITQTLADAEKISTTPAAGGNKTFNDFGANKDTDNKIDFVFVKKNTKVLSHKVDTTVYNNLYPSDHFPVFTKLDLSAPAQQ